MEHISELLSNIQNSVAHESQWGEFEDIWVHSQGISFIFNSIWCLVLWGVAGRRGSLKRPNRSCLFYVKEPSQLCTCIAAYVLSWGLGDENYFRTLFCSMLGSQKTFKSGMEGSSSLKANLIFFFFTNYLIN